MPQGYNVWFAVAREHAAKLDNLVTKLGIDSLKGSWWPNLEDLTAAGIPFKRFIQKPRYAVQLCRQISQCCFPGSLPFAAARFALSIFKVESIALTVAALTQTQGHGICSTVNVSLVRKCPSCHMSWSADRYGILHSPFQFGCTMVPKGASPRPVHQPLLEHRTSHGHAVHTGVFGGRA